MRRKFTLTLAGISLLALASCSTGKLAQTGVDNDDVYNPVAKAKEVPKYEEKQSSYRTDEQMYGGNDYTNEEYEGEYASRIDRFYYNRPWRSFYDSYYSYRFDPWYDYYYGFNSWYRPGVSINIGWGSPWYYDNYYWGYYGSPYYSRYWGPYSYYNSYPGYYGGYYPRYGYGYPGRAYTSPNYRSRPNRETNIGRGASGSYSPAPSRGTTSTNGRPERTPGRIGTTSSRPSGSGTSGTSTENSRPSRPARTQEVRTPRESSSPRPQSRPTEYSRPERTSSGSSSGSSSSGRSSSGSSSSGGSSSSRPSRGGR